MPLSATIYTCLLPVVLSAHEHSNNDLRNTGFYWIVVNLTPLNMQSLFGKHLASTLKKSQLQKIITFFTFYYYSNKNTHYKTIFFSLFHTIFFYFFSLNKQFFSTWYHINHFLLLLKNKTHIKSLYQTCNYFFPSKLSNLSKRGQHSKCEHSLETFPLKEDIHHLLGHRLMDFKRQKTRRPLLHYIMNQKMIHSFNTNSCAYDTYPLE
jgi:hypothetical protein